MADKKVEIDILINTANAANKISDIKESIEDLTDATKEFGKGSVEFEKLNKKAKELSDKLEGIGPAAKKGEAGLDGISTGFKGIGTAMKAAGIGLIIGLFATLKEILEKQQPVLDAVDTAFTAIGLVITAVSDALTSAFAATSEANGGFDATGKVINGLITLSLLPFKLIIQGIKAAVVGAQLVWEKSFFGNGDPIVIAELEKKLGEIKDDVVEIGKGALAAGKDIATNIVEAAGEVTSLVTAVVDNISKIDGAAILATAKRTTELKNQAQIAAAVNAGLVEVYDRLAEKQRQIRDNETISISDRIKANDELGGVLEKQQALMLKNADLSIAAAAAEFNANKTIENQVKLITSRNEKAGVLAQIEGLRSEQIVNRIGLEKELTAVTQAGIDGSVERAKAQRDFDAEQILNDGAKLQRQKENLVLEAEAELTRLENIKQLTKEGTQARIDADNAYLLAKQDFANKEKEIDAAILLEKTEVKNANDIINAEIKVATDATDIQAKIDLLTIQRDIDLQNAQLTSDEKIKIEQEYSEKVRQLRLAEASQNLKIGQDSATALQGLSDTVFAIKSANTKKGSKEEEANARKQFKVNKALAIAGAIMSSAQAAIASMVPAPLVTPVGIAAFAATIATGLASVAKIAGTQFTSTSAGAIAVPDVKSASAPSGDAPTPPANRPDNNIPELNKIGRDTNTNQSNQPQKVYVVASDISSSQNQQAVLDRRSSF